MAADVSEVVVVNPPRGAFKCKVDDRGRLKLPAEIHRYYIQLGENTVFVTSLDEKIGCIYTPKAWRENEVILANLPDQKLAKLMKTRADYYGGDATIDPQGRISLPDELRQGLKLDNQDIKLMHFKGHFNMLAPADVDRILQECRQANLDEVEGALV